MELQAKHRDTPILFEGWERDLKSGDAQDSMEAFPEAALGSLCGRRQESPP